MGARGEINRLRLILWDRQKGLCHYCEIHMVRTRKPHPECVTVDHIIPKCDGGTRALHNVVGACWTCNNARGSTPYAMFMALVKTRGRPEEVILPGGSPSPGEWLNRRAAKAARRAWKAALMDAPHAPAHMPANRPYLAGVAKYPTLAEALADAGAVPEELNDALQTVRERWET